MFSSRSNAVLIRDTALSISFIRNGSWRSSNEGLKNCLALSYVSIPRCTSNVAILVGILSCSANAVVVIVLGVGFKVQRINLYLF